MGKRQALAELPAPRALITTPLHLRICLEENIPLPALALTVSAAAPLSAELAQRAEDTFGTTVMELYGCTESGAIASRRTVQDEHWQTMAGISVFSDSDGQAWVEGGHVAAPTPLQDVIESTSLSPSSLPQAGAPAGSVPAGIGSNAAQSGEKRVEDSLREAHVIAGGTRFPLLGRKADLVNIAGKRASLGDLNRQLGQIPGVKDGIFFAPDDTPGTATRLTALVVAPDLQESEIIAALRQKIDAAFLPRPLHKVESLPRTATGKLPRTTLIALLDELQRA